MNRKIWMLDLVTHLVWFDHLEFPLIPCPRNDVGTVFVCEEFKEELPQLNGSPSRRHCRTPPIWPTLGVEGHPGHEGCRWGPRPRTRVGVGVGSGRLVGKGKPGDGRLGWTVGQTWAWWRRGEVWTVGNSRLSMVVVEQRWRSSVRWS